MARIGQNGESSLITSVISTRCIQVDGCGLWFWGWCARFGSWGRQHGLQGVEFGIRCSELKIWGGWVQWFGLGFSGRGIRVGGCRLGVRFCICLFALGQRRNNSKHFKGFDFQAKASI